MDEIFKHAFRVCAMWDAQAFLLMNYCSFNIEPFCSDVCGDDRRPQTLAEICRIMGIWCDFRPVAAREKYPGFILLTHRCCYFLCNHDQYGTSSLFMTFSSIFIFLSRFLSSFEWHFLWRFPGNPSSGHGTPT